MSTHNSIASINAILKFSYIMALKEDQNRLKQILKVQKTERKLAQKF